VERLRAAVGATVYLAELDGSDVQLGVRITDKPYVLLGVVDFPRPDPERGLAPHLVVLDDGRGVNLGRIARLSVGRAFAPAPGEILFQDRATLDTLLFQGQRLSPELIAQRSKALLGRILGHGAAPSQARLDAPHGEGPRGEDPPGEDSPGEGSPGKDP
jgi:hypothetical protein